MSRYDDTSRQRCKVCGRVDGFNFQVDDSVWVNVVPEAYLHHVVCLPCFDEFAAERGIRYEEALFDALHFAGAGEALVWRLVRRGHTSWGARATTGKVEENRA